MKCDWRLKAPFDVEVVRDDGAAAHRPGRRVLTWVLPSAAASAIRACIGDPLVAGRPATGGCRFEIHRRRAARFLRVPGDLPDGRTLASVMTGPDGTDRIHVRNFDAVDSRALEVRDDPRCIRSGAPDGGSLAFVSGNVLKRVDTDGGPPRQMLAARITAPWQGA